MVSNDGSYDEKPPHKVYLDGYWMGKYEVTFAQYDKYCEETGKKKPSDEGWGRGNRPVIYVSWDDAKEYCDWLSNKTGLKFKLPTEAQWEKAARGADSRKYPWGNSSTSGEKANFADKQEWLKEKDSWADKDIDDGYAYTAPVGSYPRGASPYGLFDMAGNVWEWCSDWYDSDYYKKSPGNNPTGPKSGTYRVVRGGSWDYYARDLRCANRFYDGPSDRYSDHGFRLCQDNR
jgi:formylglycine-generating enzyme required for sulfatase activity